MTGSLPGGEGPVAGVHHASQRKVAREAPIPSLSFVSSGSGSNTLCALNELSVSLMGWFVLVPLALASLFTGLVQSLGTQWGLFRHYWVVFKLLINLFATIVLLMYTQTLSSLADAAETTFSSDDLGVLRSPSPVLHAGAALLLLLVATTLAVYKPRGLTPYGQRRHEKRRLWQA